MNDQSPALPFEDLPPRPETPGRRRTNEDWKNDDPDSYEEVVERILGLDINVSKLAEEFAPLRKKADGTVGMTKDAMRRAIGALISTDPRLGIAKFRELKKLKLELVEAEMLDKVSELGEKAKKGDLLGAAAMAMKMTRDTLNAQGGAATVVIRHEHSITLDSETQRRREELRKRLEIEAASGSIIDVVAQLQPEKEQA